MDDSVADDGLRVLSSWCDFTSLFSIQIVPMRVSANFMIIEGTLYNQIKLKLQTVISSCSGQRFTFWSNDSFCYKTSNELKKVSAILLRYIIVSLRFLLLFISRDRHDKIEREAFFLLEWANWKRIIEGLVNLDFFLLFYSSWKKSEGFCRCTEGTYFYYLVISSLVISLIVL